MIKRNTIGFVLVLLFLLTNSCENRSADLDNQPVQVDAQAYDSMRNFFSSDTTFIAKLKSKIDEGDKDAIKLKSLLETKYDLRNSTGITDSSIVAMIFAYRAAKELKGEFEAIDSSVGNYRSESIKAKTDSILNKLDSLTKELNPN